MIYTADIASGGKREWSRDREANRIDAIADLRERLKNAKVQIQSDSAEGYS